jgi:hypothetical protein
MTVTVSFTRGSVAGRVGQAKPDRRGSWLVARGSKTFLAIFERRATSDDPRLAPP